MGQTQPTNNNVDSFLIKMKYDDNIHIKYDDNIHIIGKIYRREGDVNQSVVKLQILPPVT